MENREPVEKKRKVVQTFGEDMAGALGDSSGIEIKKIIHDEEARVEEKQNLSPEATKNRLLLIFGFVAIFVGAVLLSYFLFNRSPSSVTVPPQFVPLVFTDKSELIEVADLDKNQVATLVRSKMREVEVKNGGVVGFYLIENNIPVGLRRFLGLIKANFVPNYNAVQDNFLLGFAKNETDDFFILLKMNSVADIFDSMKAWERKMFSDLHAFFDIPLTSATGPLLTKNFEDGIVENKNARILYDNAEDKNIILMYVFPDENSVIIANSSLAVEEIIVRLAQNQIKRD